MEFTVMNFDQDGNVQTWSQSFGSFEAAQDAADQADGSAWVEENSSTGQSDDVALFDNLDDEEVF